MSNRRSKLFDWMISRHTRLFYKLAYYILPEDMTNLNLDLVDGSQRRALICYLSLNGITDMGGVGHAAVLHYNQMIHYFIERGYCVDTCYCNDETAFERLGNRQYDVVIGFGKAYKMFAAALNASHKVLFVTENNPKVVKTKYEERVVSFKNRHSNIPVNKSISRNDFYDTEQFGISDCSIIMSSMFNAASMFPFFEKAYTINSNAIMYEKYRFDEALVKSWIPSSKRNFLWFGSTGFIHKGGDLVLDAMKELPDCHVDFYGINKYEKSLWKRLKVDNATDCGYVNVQSKQFVSQVVQHHCFLILPSCSEGMCTSVCTCMAHGIIPIITKECGLEPHPSIIEIDDWSVGGIIKVMRYALSLSDTEILKMRREAYYYARESFTLDIFDKRFHAIMDEVLSD